MNRVEVLLLLNHQRHTSLQWFLSLNFKNNNIALSTLNITLLNDLHRTFKLVLLIFLSCSTIIFEILSVVNNSCFLLSLDIKYTFNTLAIPEISSIFCQLSCYGLMFLFHLIELHYSSRNFTYYTTTYFSLKLLFIFFYFLILLQLFTLYVYMCIYNLQVSLCPCWCHEDLGTLLCSQWSVVIYLAFHSTMHNITLNCEFA